MNLAFDISHCFQIFQHRFHLNEELDSSLWLLPDQFKVGFLNTSVLGSFDLVKFWWTGLVPWIFILDIINTFQIHFRHCQTSTGRKFYLEIRKTGLPIFPSDCYCNLMASLSYWIRQSFAAKARIKRLYCGLIIFIVLVLNERVLNTRDQMKSCFRSIRSC